MKGCCWEQRTPDWGLVHGINLRALSYANVAVQGLAGMNRRLCELSGGRWLLRYKQERNAYLEGWMPPGRLMESVFVHVLGEKEKLKDSVATTVSRMR